MNSSDVLSVIVTDADDRKGLAAVRSLGRLGCRVTAAGTKRWDRSFFSRYCSDRLIYPNPARDAEAFAAFMLETVARRHYDCIMPMSDYATIPLSLHKAEFLKHTGLAVPDYETLSLVRNKPEILKIARALGIGAPETWCPANLDEAADLSTRIQYPCVVKYKKGTGAIGVRYAHSPAEMLDHFQKTLHKTDVVFDDAVPMVQEYIPGGIYDVCVLFNNGEPRAAELHERTKMYPPSGGYGAAYETRLDPDLIDKGLRLLEEVRWHGPALVEFKKDSRDGSAKLMEVNTRFWGGIDVSACAGIDFVRLAVQLAVRGDVEPMWDYRVGMKYRWLANEFRRALICEHPVRELLSLLRIERDTYYDVSLSDPLPHLMKTALSAWRALASPFRRSRKPPEPKAYA